MQLDRLRFTLFAMAFTLFSSQAQTLTVLDREDKAPIERATIVLPLSGDYLYTNDRGEADLSELNLPGDTNRLIISSLGYEVLRLTFADLRKKDFKLFLEPAALSLNQVVISANRWQQSSRELPFRIATLKRREALLYHPANSADLIGQTGEVFIQKSQQGGGSPMIRGFATNRLLLAVDGIRMNNAIFRSGNLQNIISLDPYAIERSEIYFGPGSLLYGSDAIGGVMSFQTLRPQFSQSDKTLFTGEVAARHATVNNEFSQHLHFNLGNERLAFLSSFSFFNYGDLRMGRHGPSEYLDRFYVQRIDSTDRVIENDEPRLQIPSGYRQFNTMQKLHYRASANWSLAYDFHYSRTSDYPRVDRLERTRNQQPRAAEWYYGPQEWQMHQLRSEWSKRNLFFDRSTLRLAWQRFRESRHDRDFGDPLLRERFEKLDAYSLNLDQIKRVAGNHKLFYGLEAVLNDLRSRGTLTHVDNQQTFAGASRYPDGSWLSLGAYLNHEWEWSPGLTSQLGLRYNHFQIQADFRDNLAFYPLPFEEVNLNNQALTGSFGLVYRPNERWKWQINLGSAFRAPNIDDIGKFFDSGEDLVVVPNAELGPEYAYSADIGVGWIINQAFKIDLNVYLTYLDQALVRRSFRFNGQDSLLYDGELRETQAIQNAAFARVYGLQASFEWQINEQLRWNNHINIQEGEEELEDGNLSPSRHAAPAFGRSTLLYRWQRYELRLYSDFSAGVPYRNLNFEERSKPFIYATNAEGQPYSPGWYTLNFTAAMKINESLDLNAGVQNITDQRYRPYSSGLVAPGRNFTLGLNFEF